MTLKEYQERAMTTCMTSCYNVPYMVLNLQGEVGELSSKLAKHIRKDELEFITDTDGTKNASVFAEDYDTEAIIGELGDVLWQLAGVCEVMGFALEDVAQYNLAKLADRQKRGVISGEGDKR